MEHLTFFNTKEQKKTTSLETDILQIGKHFILKQEYFRYSTYGKCHIVPLAGQFNRLSGLSFCRFLEKFVTNETIRAPPLSDFEHFKIGKETATDGRKRKILYWTERTDLRGQ